MPTITRDQPIDETMLRAAALRFLLARFPPMPRDLAAVTFSSTAPRPQPMAVAILASRLAPPATWLRTTLTT